MEGGRAPAETEETGSATQMTGGVVQGSGEELRDTSPFCGTEMRDTVLPCNKGGDKETLQLWYVG